MFCYGELGLTGSEIDELTWVEFILRQRGYYIRKRLELENIRLISYNNFLAHWDNPKKKPPTIDKYWQLDKPKNTEVSQLDKMTDKFKQAYSQYLKDKK